MKVSIKANGNTYEVEKGATLESFLQSLNLTLKMVVVEYNGIAQTRTEAASISLEEDDVLEIVRIVAGG